MFRAVAFHLLLLGAALDLDSDLRNDPMFVEDTKCPEDLTPDELKQCACGFRHPTFDYASHSFMLCRLNIQGVDLQMTGPIGGDWYQGKLHFDEPRHYEKPKLFPPWDRDSKLPLSLYPIEHGSIVLDIGASFGLFTLLVAKTYPDVKVIAVEPVGWMRELLVDNLGRNGIREDQVEVLAAPISKDGREVEFFQPYFSQFLANMYRGPGIHGENHFGPWQTVPMKSQSFKDFLQMKDFETRPISFAQVDCNGCEYEIMDDVAKLNIPFWMRCNGPTENPMQSVRQWLPMPYMNEFIPKRSAEKCLMHQENAENIILERGLKKGRAVETVISGLQLLAEGNGNAMMVLSKVSLHYAQLDELPEGAVRGQYEVLMHALFELGSFLYASALETGEGVPRDRDAAKRIFDNLVTSSTLDDVQADIEALSREMPMIKDVKPGSMYRLGEIMSQDGNGDEALRLWKMAAQLGHELARSRMKDTEELVGTNGLVVGNGLRQIMTRTRMEAMGVPAALQQALLGVTASANFDHCMVDKQKAGMERWVDVFDEQKLKYTERGAYRFRSWMHSAMDCLMDP